MKRKVTDVWSAGEVCEPKQLQAAADFPSQTGQTGRMGGLRIADLFDLTDQTTVALDHLRRIDAAARQVVGSHLRAHTLDRKRLELLELSVARQASQARQLQAGLARNGADRLLHDELADLIEFLDEALDEIGQQLRQVQ